MNEEKIANDLIQMNEKQLNTFSNHFSYGLNAKDYNEINECDFELLTKIMNSKNYEIKIEFSNSNKFYVFNRKDRQV